MNIQDMDTRLLLQALTQVGIPLRRGLPVRNTIAKPTTRVRRQVIQNSDKVHMNPLLRVRSFMAYAPFALDFLAYGFLFPTVSVATVQALTRRH